MVNALMLAICGFVGVYGTRRCLETLGQSVAELPWLPVGVTCAAIPLGAFAPALFVVERIDLPLDAVMIQLAAGVNKFSLLAIPVFVLAGAIMAEGGMSRRLVAFAGVLVGFIRGPLPPRSRSAAACRPS